MILALCTIFEGDDLQDPPPPLQLELIVDRLNGVDQIVLFLCQLVSALLGIQETSDDGHVSVDGSRAWFDVGVETVRIESEGGEKRGVEPDACAREEAFSDHPSKRDTRQIMLAAIRDRTATHICKRND